MTLKNQKIIKVRDKITLERTDKCTWIVHDFVKLEPKKSIWAYFVALLLSFLFLFGLNDFTETEEGG